jgi:signal transduction histidine kinase
MNAAAGTSGDAVVGDVLVVDDEAKNRRLLRDVLSAKGYSVSEATNGEEALRCAREQHPDVILLDVMMPKLDGFEVCRELKADDETAATPILMVTALTERADRMKGIEAGANDFISKPIDTEEVALRVRNAIQMKRLHDRVKDDLHKLQDLEQLRDNLVHMIIHDLRSPIMTIMLGIQALSDRGGTTPDDQRFATRAASAARELNEMVTSLLDISRMESGLLTPDRHDCDVRTIAASAVESLEGNAELEDVRLELSGDLACASVDKDLMRRVFQNLVGNAIKFSPAGSTIRVAVRADSRTVRVAVTDAGPGVPGEYRDKIFEKFGQVKARQDEEKHSTGLGLTFCKLAVEAHGGTIGVDSEVGNGSTFWFELPTGR